jgi:hypothetical protein
MDQDIYKLIYSLYPKIDWTIETAKDYRDSKEQQAYRKIRTMRLNNHSEKLKKLFKKEGLFFKNYTAVEFPCFEYEVLLARVDDLLVDGIAGGNKKVFLKKFYKLRLEIYNNPAMLNKAYWLK